MASSHWKAFAGIPDTFMKDLPAILYYAGSSWLSSMLHTQVRTSLPGNDYAPYFVDGVIQTLNQDYLINLIGQEDRLPKDGSSMMSSAYTGYNY